MTEEPTTTTTPEETPDAQQQGVNPDELLRYAMYMMVTLPPQSALGFAVSVFAEQGWIHLGIHTNPATGETEANLPQAKLAIDALAALIPLLEGQASPNEARDLRNLLSSLQLNYVQRSA